MHRCDTFLPKPSATVACKCRAKCFDYYSNQCTSSVVPRPFEFAILLEAAIVVRLKIDQLLLNCLSRAFDSICRCSENDLSTYSTCFPALERGLASGRYDTLSIVPDLTASRGWKDASSDE